MRKSFWLFVLRLCLPYMYRARDHYMRAGKINKADEFMRVIAKAESAIYVSR